MTAKEIRQSFKNYFEEKGHKIVPSGPMVINGDPTLMFTNAGMNQFKDIILGNTPIKYTRVADSQKCLRVSGKHNDLEEVGYDTYHHTMFEMLGNWSFGDYFKKEAIEYAWEYLTDVLKLDKNQLYVTVFGGSTTEHLVRDNETAVYWEKYLPKNRIIDGNRKDNFWEMGDTGPCGPCSEIHIDLRSKEERARVDGLMLVNHNHPLVIEIWNLVFMQFNRKSDGTLESLPNKVIDTGMGFERLCMAAQGKTSSYDTDVFQSIIHTISRITNFEYGEDVKKDIAMRVIADHVRATAFSITDGQLPSNVKAGYVIRRILRRAVRYGYTFLGQKKAFMYQLIPALIDSMGDIYSELITQEKLIEQVMKDEEESFLRTLGAGIKLLDKQIQGARVSGKTVIEGTNAFVLYDTYGFPFDLTESILLEHGLKMDKVSFDIEMKKQKERARNAATVEISDWTVVKDGEPEFVGYDETSVVTHIFRYRKMRQKNVEYYQIVLNKTPFYAEMGGQVGDSGQLIDSSGNKIEVFDTKRENNLTVHLTKQLPENLYDVFIAVINEKKRNATECNHTATHLLHEALRDVLGIHVEQKGSFVSSDILRFDFSHFQKVTDEELRLIEKSIAEKIRMNIQLDEKRNISILEAKQMGAIALFGEKYGDVVRIIRFGTSIELCGGTHIASTGSIGNFRIVNESSIAAGVRRIEAITSEAADDFIYAQQDLIRNIKSYFNNIPDLLTAVKKVLEENAELKKRMEKYIKEQTVLIKKRIINDKQSVNDINLFVLQGVCPTKIVKDIAFQLKGEFSKRSCFIAATKTDDGKPLLTLMISDDLVRIGLNAGQIVCGVAKYIQGGGGGQPHFAVAGGKDVSGLEMALKEMIAKFNNKNYSLDYSRYEVKNSD